MSKKSITLENMNPSIIRMQDAVQDPVRIRADEIEKELQMGIKKPFKEVIRADIGDSQALGQKPITYIRQVLTLCIYPDLLKDDTFPSDVKKKASDILNGCGGRSLGAYSDSNGVEIVRQHIAEYIKRRDGIPCDTTNIAAFDGASSAIKGVMNIFNCDNNGKISGVMVPTPQCPLYSTIVTELKMHLIKYYLDEEKSWGISLKEMKRAINEARKVCQPKLLVVINPGNPTGSVLTRENIEMIIKFAYEEGLFLMADEVYQDNIYGEGMQFFSFKKVMMEMGEPYKNMELASFMSASKGYVGECGLRSGFVELINMDLEVRKMIEKGKSIMPSNVLGQVALDCVVNPPQPGEPSYNLFIKEKTKILQSLKENAELITRTFNSMKNIKCNAVRGGMYAFPQLILPEKAIETAKSLDQSPDFFYAMRLLESTGICVVPGSTLGQVPWTYHFRISLLLQPEKLKEMFIRFEKYHNKFLEEYK